jgi:hypothetical protein
MGNSSRLFSENRGFGFSECGRYALPPLSSPVEVVFDVMLFPILCLLMY